MLHLPFHEIFINFFNGTKHPLVIFVIAIVLMLTNESNKIALPERYSGYPSLLFVVGLAGMATTAFMWGVLHFLDW